ncbi:MAG: OmpA family protein [Nitrospirae bacterium]|nr:OmpA family protein [Nitrospirota bacterium]
MKGQNIIIKKVKKGGHGGHHGGSWKVAYADFVTAMMAFFLLMWLLNMTSPTQKAAISQYFTNLSIFDALSMSFVGKGKDIADTGVTHTPKEQLEKTDSSEPAAAMDKEKFKEKLKKDIEEKLAEIKDQVLIDVIEGGVRVQIVDKDGKPMFALGSPELAPDAKKVIKIIADNLVPLKNIKLSIEGHTDALGYSSNKYTNWELSTDRASAARRELERDGLDPNDLSRVAGFAATEPLIADNPNDPRNRRISILIYSKDTSKIPTDLLNINPDAATDAASTKKEGKKK